MKKYYEVEIELVSLQAQDVVTASGFGGGDHDFENPNGDTDPTGIF